MPNRRAYFGALWIAVNRPLTGSRFHSAVISYYRKAVIDGTLNLPKLREYCKALPKGDIFRTRVRKEIL